MVSRIALALAALLPAILAKPVATTDNPWPQITPVTTTVGGQPLTISAWCSTCSFTPDHTATETAIDPKPTHTWPKNTKDASGKPITKCDEKYTVKEGDTCNKIIGTDYLYWDLDPQHLVFWNPNLGMNCENLKIGMELCLFDNTMALNTETHAYGWTK